MCDIVILICMDSYLVELVASTFPQALNYTHFLCIGPVNALEILHMCIDLREPSLLEPATNIKNSSAGSYQWACMLCLVDKASGLEFRIWEWTMLLDILVQGSKCIIWPIKLWHLNKFELKYLYSFFYKMKSNTKLGCHNCSIWISLANAVESVFWITTSKSFHNKIPVYSRHI